MIEGILTWKRSCLGNNELKKVAFSLSEDKIAEFLTKTERKKGKNAQNILFDGCYLRFEEHLREKKKTKTSVYILKPCREIGQIVCEEVKFVEKYFE